MDLGLCTIQRDRGPWLTEWLAFHHVVGFRKFFFYAHCCTDDTAAKLRKLGGALDIACFEINEEMDFVQLKVYQHAYDHYGAQVDWMAFIDGDEFLFPVEAETLQDALAEFAAVPASALGVYWHCYGSSGHVREPEGLLIENYLKRHDTSFIRNRHVKSIVKGGQAIRANMNAHLFGTPHGTVDELLRPVTHGFMKDLEPSHAKLRINHYICQSRDYYTQKKKNAGMADAGAAGRRADDWWELHDRNDVHDELVLRLRDQVAAKRAEFEALLAA
jgi:hypothetical protein